MMFSPPNDNTPVMGRAEFHPYPVGAVVMGRVATVKPKRVVKKARKRRRTLRKL
jgi:hypothetical protein